MMEGDVLQKMKAGKGGGGCQTNLGTHPKRMSKRKNHGKKEKAPAAK